MLYAGNNLEKARDIFAEAIKHRPRIRLTIRQRTRVPTALARSWGQLSTCGRFTVKMTWAEIVGSIDWRSNRPPHNLSPAIAQTLLKGTI
jgi:hypothetical protein